MLLDRLEDIEHARFRAQAQILLDKEEGAKAFEEYMKIAFPSLEQRRQQRNDELKKKLDDWVGRGPLRVTPLQEPRVQSRMKRAIRVQNPAVDKALNKVKI